ncbi:MAG TPA: FAD-binding oxidoreductase, partial [Acidimicrobiales bacterium]
KRVDVDVDQMLATVEPGVLWGEYDAATQAHGLASPGGEVSHTGVAGLTLGGGIGWLSRRFGLACDHLVAAEVVLADGSIVTASETERPDLLWALRGGGGNFGVVTRFTFRLRHVGPMAAGLVLHPMDRAADVLELAEAVRRDAPDEVAFVAALVTAPPAPWVPEQFRLQPAAAIAACYVGPIDDGHAALAPIRGFGEPVVDTFGVHRYTDIQRWFDEGVPHGRHYYLRSEWLNALGADAIGALVEAGAGRTSPLSQVLVRSMGGAIARVPPGATAFRFRDADYLLTIVAAWDPPDAAAEDHRTWCRAAWSALRPASAGGGYVNHLTNEGQDRVREAYGDETWNQLVAIKDAYDPTNLFHMNQNIPPSR